jgi:uncharacterized protein (TIGR00255 family)
VTVASNGVRRQGMTGFGRSSGEAEWGQWTVEVKSVNGRGLDVRVNLPPGFEALEPKMREAARKRFLRGNLQLSLRLNRDEAGEAVEVNHAALRTLVEAWHAGGGGRTGAMISGEAIATLMTCRGVLNPASGNGLRDLAGDEALLETLGGGVDAALEALEEARLKEGDMLAGLLGGLLEEMAAQVDSAEAEAGTVPEALKAKLEERIAALGGLEAMDEGRLETEIALLASRADVREEIDRLRAHLASGRNLLAAEGAVGRKLDFLAQELMREANTLCSKSTSLVLTNAGLALKALIDQFKEQAANVE